MNFLCRKQNIEQFCLVTQNAALYYYANKENINLTSTNVLYEMLILKNLCRSV
jgi:hypothetical protein